MRRAARLYLSTELFPDVPKGARATLERMPTDVLDAVRKMVATAADDRTPEHQRTSTAVKACELIARHKLLEGAKPTGTTLENVIDVFDALSERADTILERFSRIHAPRRRRYRRR